MPELPEVESARRQIEASIGGKIAKLVYVDTKDKIVFDRAAAAKVRKAIEGARIVGVRRKGKYMWIELNRKPWPVIHLGMSGHVELRQADGNWQRDKRRAKPVSGPGALAIPKYCKLMITAADGTAIAVTDPRRFGRVRLAVDPLREPPISELGKDPLEDFPAPGELRKMIATRKAPIKSVLLDQSVFAGVGNWIADEILFQAKLSPHRLANSLSAAEVTRLHSRMHAIIRKAVAVGADYERFPKTWLFHDRWGKKKEAYNSRGYEIRHDTIGGRTSAWVPALQK